MMAPDHAAIPSTECAEHSERPTPLFPPGFDFVEALNLTDELLQQVQLTQKRRTIEVSSSDYGGFQATDISLSGRTTPPMDSRNRQVP